MAKKARLKKENETIYPLTIPEAVKDPQSNRHIGEIYATKDALADKEEKKTFKEVELDNYTLTENDVNNFLVFNSNNPVALYVPESLDRSIVFKGVQNGDGKITFAGVGLIEIESADSSLETGGKNDVFRLTKKSENKYVLQKQNFAGAVLTSDELAGIKNANGLSAANPAATMGDLLQNVTIVNILDFGAVGDGVTNDQPAFQAAVDAIANKGGGMIYAPKGNYLFQGTEGVKWKNKVSLKGDGIGQTNFIVDGQFDGGGVFYNIDYARNGTDGNNPDAWLSNINFSDFTIDGAGYTNVESTAESKGIFILYIRDSYFKNLEIKNTIGTGFGIDFLDGVLIDNVKAINNGRLYGQPGSTAGQSGIGIGTGSTFLDENFTIENCVAIDNGNYGIFVESQSFGGVYIYSKNIKIDKCISSGNKVGFGNRFVGYVDWNNITSKNNEQGFFSEGVVINNVENSYFEENKEAFIVTNSDIFNVGGTIIKNNEYAFYTPSGIPNRPNFNIYDSFIINNDEASSLIVNNFSINNSTIKNNNSGLTFRRSDSITISNNHFQNTGVAIRNNSSSNPDLLSIEGNLFKDNSNDFSNAGSIDDFILRNNIGIDENNQNETITGNWEFSNPVTGADATADVHLATLGQTKTQKLEEYTVATLPASPIKGDQAFVTDADTPSWNTTVTGGGSSEVVVWYNGINWIIH